MLSTKKAYHNGESIQAEITYPENGLFLNAHRTPIKNKSAPDIQNENPSSYHTNENGFFTGLICGLPISILLWAIIWSSIKLLF